MSDDETELTVSIKMSDIITLVMTKKELNDMPPDKQLELFAEHLNHRIPKETTTHAVQHMLVEYWIDGHDIMSVKYPVEHVCDNCTKEWRTEQLPRQWPHIPDLGERLDPGGVIPSGECPECQGLCYPLTAYDDAQRLQDMELLLKEDFSRNDGGDPAYQDYDRKIPGFGSDGLARLERVTFFVETSHWGSTVAHNEPGGKVTHENSDGGNGSLRAAIRNLEEDRKIQEAKRKKVE